VTCFLVAEEAMCSKGQKTLLHLFEKGRFGSYGESSQQTLLCPDFEQSHPYPILSTSCTVSCLAWFPQAGSVRSLQERFNLRPAGSYFSSASPSLQGCRRVNR